MTTQKEIDQRLMESNRQSGLNQTIGYLQRNMLFFDAQRYYTAKHNYFQAKSRLADNEKDKTRYQRKSINSFAYSMFRMDMDMIYKDFVQEKNVQEFYADWRKKHPKKK